MLFNNALSKIFFNYIYLTSVECKLHHHPPIPNSSFNIYLTSVECKYIIAFVIAYVYTGYLSNQRGM